MSARRTGGLAAACGLIGAELVAVSSTFRALSDPTRLRILSLLAERECCVHQLCDGMGMSQPAVSHQLRLLRVACLVRGRREGREVFYALDDEHVMELVVQARTHASHPHERRASASGRRSVARPARTAAAARRKAAAVDRR